MKLDRQIEAVESFDRVLAQIPRFAPAFFHKGIALAGIGMFDEAILSFNIALEITPDDSAILYQKGLALAQLENYEDAVATFDQRPCLGPG